MDIMNIDGHCVYPPLTAHNRFFVTVVSVIECLLAVPSQKAQSTTLSPPPSPPCSALLAL
jgi:hypothetical protein